MAESDNASSDGRKRFVIRFVTGALNVPPLLVVPFFSAPRGPDTTYTGSIVGIATHIYGIASAGLFSIPQGVGVVEYIVVSLLVPTVGTVLIVFAVLGGWIAFTLMVAVGSVNLMLGRKTGPGWIVLSLYALAVSMIALALPVIGPGVVPQPRVGAAFYAISLVSSTVLGST
jgi:hypothetical protein